MNRLVSGCLVLALMLSALSGCLSVAASPPEESGPCNNPGQSGEKSPRCSTPFGDGLVVASHPLAAEAGAAMLRLGGNAMDAAAAVQWALNVVEPHFSGLGGDSSILYYDRAADAVRFYDGRSTFVSNPPPPDPEDDDPPNRGYDVGVPGAAAVFALAMNDYASLELATTLAPAIGLAEDGFVVDRYLGFSVAGSSDKLSSWPATAQVFFPGTVCPLGSGAPMWEEGVGCVLAPPIKDGDTFKQPDLAGTLRLLAANGLGTFYDGPMAQAIVDTTAARSGVMTLDDLASYRALPRDPLRISYGELDVVSAPPPYGGLVVLQTLGILDGFDLGATQHNSPEALHPFIEASHLAFADWFNWTGDPDFVDVPMRGLLDADYLASRRALIDPNRANLATNEPGDPWPYEGREQSGDAAVQESGGGGTANFIVVDGWGNVASVTSTVNSGFGVGMIVPGYGFLLNNAPATAEPNEGEPGSRSLSTQSSTIVFSSGQPVMALGSGGSERIPSNVVQGILNMHHYGLSPKAAIEAGRVFSEEHGATDDYVRDPDHYCYLSPDDGDVLWDRDMPLATLDDLADRGHSPCGGGMLPIEEPEPIAWIPSVIVGHGQFAGRTEDGPWAGGADSRISLGGVIVVHRDEVQGEGPG